MKSKCNNRESDYEMNYTSAFDGDRYEEGDYNEIEILPIENGEISIGDDEDSFISEISFKNLFEETDKIIVQEMDFTSSYQKTLLCKFLTYCAAVRNKRKIEWIYLHQTKLILIGFMIA